MKTLFKTFAMCAAAALFAIGCTEKLPDEPDQKTPAAVPEITSITPDNGLAGDGVIIKGTNFSSVKEENTVMFSDEQAEVLKASDKSLTVIAPQHQPGKVNVTVTVAGQVSKPVEYTYNEPLKEPVVNGMDKNEAAIGDKLVISGENFGTSAANVTVTFGDAAAEIESVTETEITVIVPVGNGEVAVMVKIGDFDAKPAGILKYVFGREIAIESVSLTTVTEGDVVTVTCTGLEDVTAEECTVTADGVEVPVTSVSDNVITITVPKMTLGDHKAVLNVVSAAPVEATFAYYEIGQYEVSTIIGNGTAALQDGAGTDARVQIPEYVGFGPDGYLWMTTRGGTASHSIMRADPSGWTVTTVVPAATVGSGVYFWGGDFNSKGEFHVCSKGKGYIGKAVQENGSWSLSTYNISGMSPAFKSCMNLIFDANDHMYVADRDNKRVVQSFDGTYEKEYALDYQPYTIAWDNRRENIIVGFNGARRIAMLNLATSEVTVLCGTGTKPTASVYKDGSAMEATVGNASGIVMDKNGYIWFNDFDAFTLRVLVPGPEGDYTKGIVKTVAGQPATKGFADGDGLAEAKFNAQGMLAMDADGNLYVADGAGNRIRKVSLKK